MNFLLVFLLFLKEMSCRIGDPMVKVVFAIVLFYIYFHLDYPHVVKKLIILNGIPVGPDITIRVFRKNISQLLMSSYVFFFQVFPLTKLKFLKFPVLETVAQRCSVKMMS